MKTQKRYSDVSFNAKILRNSLMDNAIAEAKKAPVYEKRTFYNVLDLIHNDCTIKSVGISKIADAPRQIVTVTYPSSNKNVYCNPINDKVKEGMEAMQSLLEFVKNHYGNMMLHRIKTQRIIDDNLLNEKIDSLLELNRVNYKNII